MKLISLHFTIFVVAATLGCPKCPEDGPICHEIVRFTADMSGNCPCETCLTRCSFRNNICRASTVCEEKPVMYNYRTIGRSASCVEFSGCAVNNCGFDCAMGGFLIDPNGCQTCLCSNPCLELNCQNGTRCTTWTNITGGDPYYVCSSDS